MTAGPPQEPALRRGTILLLVALALATLAAYARVPGFDFVRVDDPDYVTENPWVRPGLTWAGVRWAFTEAWASNWHPLTWLSHQLDVTLFGLDPAGHHAMAVALHVTNALLCYAALNALTGRRGASLVCAGLFALHPLRVESVAWVSERKDLLAGLFFFLTLLGYARSVRGAARWPALRAGVVVPFALGLMAKPMLVTVPVVLLLLEAWPLGRWRGAADDAGGGPASLGSSPGAASPAPTPGAPSPAPTLDTPSPAPTRPGKTHGARTGYALALEKLPLLGLALLSCALTLWSQRKGGSLYPLEAIPLAARLANAPLAVARYVEHFLVPHDLAYFYPHAALVTPGRSPWTPAAIAAAVGLVVVLWLLWRARRRQPAALVGVALFLVMLVPVVGLVQVGEQAWADRYAYLPTLGLAIAIVFPLEALARARPATARPLAAGALLALATLGTLTFRQTAAWRDSEALFTRGLAVTRDNYAAHVGLANLAAERGRAEAARAHYDTALAIRADYAPALYGLGLLEQRLGHADAAIEQYRRAIASLPQLAAAHLNLGGLLGHRDPVAAAQCFERVLELAPGHPDAHFNLAQLLLASGRPEAAVPHFEATLATRPDMAVARESLGRALEALGRDEDAIATLRGGATTPGGRQLLAWLLATAPDERLRDGPAALRLVEALAREAGEEDAERLEVLAAALAECGDLRRAQEVQEAALARSPPGRSAQARARLERYRAGQPLRHEH